MEFMFQRDDNPWESELFLIWRGVEIEVYGHHWKLGLVEFGEEGVLMNYFIDATDGPVLLIQYIDKVPMYLWGRGFSCTLFC
jgi:hypothetical protein